ncbi:hypothetical protein BD410DRAFT_146985 [Rickenella mellea]|uniref:Uncharacterized protein n=1 Tax=Rickenella mellea TaxID=50990 RepID=A0A4Y7Q9E1_9AGAM|nr:hypothetical protein BD410DRAFT_146985 [Rickenella mellea]
MVFLNSRFVVLATICTLTALPESITSADARAILARTHSQGTAVQQSAQSAHTSGGKTQHKPVLPLPDSVVNGSSDSSKHHKAEPTGNDSTSGGSHSKGEKKKEKKKGGKRRLARSFGDENGVRDQPEDRKHAPSRIMGRRHHHHGHGDTVVIENRSPSPEPRHHHHHHDHKRSEGDDVWDLFDPLVQVGSLSVGDGRGGSYSDTHHILKRRRQYHQGDDVQVHFHKRSHNDVVIVNDHHRAHDVIIEDAHSHGRYHVIHLRDTSAAAKRDVEGLPGVPGTASEPTPSNTTTSAPSTPTANSFILDASNSTQTQVYLVASSPSNSTNSTDSNTTSNSTAGPAADIKVTLQVPVFEPSKASMEPYCATFDPNPPAPAPLSMERCFGDDAPVADDGSMKKSQTFAYNPSSGVIRPVWLSADIPDTQQTLASQNDGGDPSAAVNSTGASTSMTPSSTPTSSSNTTSTGTASSVMPSATPQEVTLVFTPIAPAVDAVDNSVPADSSSSISMSTSSSTSSVTATDSSTASVTSTTATVTESVSATTTTTGGASATTTAAGSSEWMYAQPN